jgi:hypothetical protein
MSKLKCCKCSKIATWIYLPGEIDQNYCDIHVPRGCTCQEDENNPCCEYWYKEEGWGND